MALATVPSLKEIVRLFKSSKLLAELAQRHETGDGYEDLFFERCIVLQNRGDIDLLILTSQRSFSELSTHAFFTAQYFYCSVIPRLDCNVFSLMECCRTLVEKAGSDLAANEPNRAFRKWCQNNPSKAASIVQSAWGGDALAKQFVTFALQATTDVDEAIEFIKTYSDDRRLSGIAALGGMVFTDIASAQRAIAVLEPLVASGSDDRVRLNALVAAFGVLRQYENTAAASRLVGSATKDPGPETLYGLASIVWQHHAMLDSNSLRFALVTLEAVNPEHVRTVREIDMGLQKLLGTKDESLVLNFLTAKLKSSELKVSDFQSTAWELTNGDEQRLYNLVVRWFLSGSFALCSNVSELMGSDMKRAFDMTVQPLHLTPVQQIFLCHKAIGFMFVKPMICCSIIISVLRGGSQEVEGPAGDLLFDPMLLNYSGDTRDYLKSISSTDAAYAPIQKALAKAEAYHASVKAVGEIKEIHPSEYQRDIVRQHNHDDMQAIHQQAEGKSILMNLVHHSTILYGQRSLNYVTDLDGKQRAVEMDLKTFEASFELPRREIIDPVGLDYMLRAFRAESFK